jgi:hypothetical protein
MTDTTFVSGTIVEAAWLNDLNNLRYGAGNAARGAALLQFIGAGTGASTTDVQTKLRELPSVTEYSSFANAIAQANSALVPLLATPTINVTHEPPSGGGAVATNGYFKKGFISGHLGIGNGITGTDAMTGILGAEYYTNPEQEVRGVSYAVYNTRTTADEPTLGWDFFGLMGAVVVGQNNTQYIRGNQKAVVGELYFQAPVSGTYAVKKSHNFQATIVELGVGVTLEDWYGFVVNTRPAGGTITNGYGVYILPMTGITNAAAIRLAGTDDGGQIKWNNSSITQLSTNKLKINLGATNILEDSSGKLEIDLDSRQLVLTDALVATTVGAAGGASALPATPQGYWRVLIGGIERKIPYYVA